MTRSRKNVPASAKQLGLPQDEAPAAGPVTVLGRTFPDDDARRAWFRDQLRTKLNDPAFRAQPGVPRGEVEAIVAMSDPPWYTACPNPWVGEFIAEHGTPYDPAVPYRREPFAVDVVEKKTGLLYQAHGYHTKVPYLAILPFVLHYTKPGDVILDGFCGSGMAGVAAQWCADPDPKFRDAVAKRFKAEDWEAPEWGARRAVLNDLSPAATFIAANYNVPFDVLTFEDAARKLLDEVNAEIGWMYEAKHPDGKVGRIEYTVWSEVFQCGACAGEIVFTEEALDDDTKRVRESFPCPQCAATLTKDILERVFETGEDPYLREPVRRIKLKPVLIRYTIGGRVHTRAPDADDLALIARVAALEPPTSFPTNKFPLKEMGHGSRLAPKGVTHVHHLFLPRARHALALMWKKADAHPDARLRLMLRFLVEQAIWGMSILNRYKTIMHGKTESSNVNQHLSGVYYIPSQMSEVSRDRSPSQREIRAVVLRADVGASATRAT